MKLYTIGFTQKTAQQFFTLLHNNGVKTLVDIRLKPDTQLSGFARKRDLPYLLRHLSQCDYQHRLEMAPSEDLFKRYRTHRQWADYEPEFKQLLETRQLIAQLDKTWWAQNAACLLCSEHEPDFCHRRLVAEYMATYWKDLEIVHLI